jgi:hypothetical protein
MRKIFFIALVGMIATSCNNNTKDVVADNRIALRTDTVNVVKLTDSLVIFESTCRGCAYERSTNFAISDSMDIIKLADIVTTDNSPADMDGGSISKDLVLVPVKPGTTTIKMYKFWSQEKTAKDSANFASYKIEVKQ